jgi:hypothetical protein
MRNFCEIVRNVHNFHQEHFLLLFLTYYLLHITFLVFFLLLGPLWRVQIVTQADMENSNIAFGPEVKKMAWNRIPFLQ